MATRYRYELGTSPSPVLVSDLLRASEESWAPITSPESVPIEGRRLVYRVSEDSSERVLVGVLSPTARLGRPILEQIEKRRREDSLYVRRSDLVSLEEAAKRLRVGIHSFRNMWKRVPSFPEPIIAAGNVRRWDMAEVRRWKKEFDRYRFSQPRASTRASVRSSGDS